MTMMGFEDRVKTTAAISQLGFKSGVVMVGGVLIEVYLVKRSAGWYEGETRH